MSLRLGAKLGDGGEGTVFALSGRDDLVAKLYHQLPDLAKQSKIREMVQCGDAKLLNFTAWPIEALTEQKSGKLSGFLMPKVSGMTPLHEVYSPAHRRQDHPEWGWNFLIFVARNLAAAFNSVHEHGHVLGDVNQGNAFVSAKSKVVLIDCDSYQINVHGQKHLCEVGVPHFTPPELQTISSFKGVVRTPNHDNFGLALLIFHILFGGRHPYAGVPLKDGVGDSLEDNIKNFRFAYSPNAASRHIGPPPRALSLSLVPSGIARMFDIAFTEDGRDRGRPTAKQWVDALDHVRSNLAVCREHSNHHYLKDQGSCPWCALEKVGVIYFAYQVGSSGAVVFTGDINKLWSAIQAVRLPEGITLPTGSSRPLQAKSKPSVGLADWEKFLINTTIVGGVIAMCAVLPQAFFIWLFVGWLMVSGVSSSGQSELNAERSIRVTAKRDAENELKIVLREMDAESGLSAARSILDVLQGLKLRFDGLAHEEREAMAELPQKAHQRQLTEHLERFYIDKAKIPGIGQAKQSTLRSFGVETAADVDWKRIRRIRGFGDVLTRALVDWRKEKERNFRFNPNRGVTDADRKQVQQRFVSIKQDTERKMREGLTKLNATKSQIESSQRRHADRLQRHYDRFLQAELDLQAMS